MDTGDRIGRYELIAHLGAGGQGEVWEAILHGPRGFRKAVALKLLPADALESGRANNLIEEARVGALIAHPNVVVVHDLGQEDERWFVAMELVRGASVEGLLETGPLPARAALEVGIGACLGLAQIHLQRVDSTAESPMSASRGSSTWQLEDGSDPQSTARAPLVHRDIKPANLLVDHTGVVKVADLGLAQLAGGKGRLGGTPGYLPPEQLAGEAEPRTDLFALGATLYEACLGRPPFGLGPRALHAPILEQARLDIPAWSDELDRIVLGLGPILRRCLRVDPAARWPDAPTLAAALDALVRDLPAGPGLQDAVLARIPGLAQVQSAPTHTRSVSIGNLPTERDRFFGRRAELEELMELATTGRLLTLLGPGGMGKTRLSLALAKRLQAQLPGGAWFFDLSDATDLPGLCSAIARPLRLTLLSDDPVAQIGYTFAARGRCLVVLDNFEQVISSASATLGRWLDHASQAVFLVTSRVVTRVRGERVHAIGPLDDEPAMALFHDRASGTVTEDDRPDVRALVTELQGMPLAIELAAARTRVMSVAAVRKALDDRLRLLAGRGDRPVRHQSLTASLDASWALLPPWACSALAQLTTFEGPFTMAAADAVLALTDPDAPGWAVDALQELADASMVCLDPGRDRFQLLVIVREHARLRGDLAVIAAAEARHGAFHARLGTREAMRRGAPSTIPLEDLIAACRRASARGDVRQAAATCAAAWQVLEARGPIALGLELAELVLAASTDGQELATPLRVAATASVRLGRLDAGVEYHRRSLAAFEAAGDQAGAAQSLVALATVIGTQGDSAEAIRVAEQACERARGLPRLTSSALGTLAALYATIDPARALELHFETVDVAHQSPLESGGAHYNLGTLLQQLGRHAECRQHHERALELFREAGNPRAEAIALSAIAMLAAVEGNPRRARADLETALSMQRDIRDRWQEAELLGKLATVAHELQDGDVLPIARRGLQIAREVGNVLAEIMSLRVLGLIAVARKEFEEAAEIFATSKRKMLERGRIPDAILAESDLALLAAERGDAALALALVDDALQRAGAVGMRPVTMALQSVAVSALLALDRVDEARPRCDITVEVARSTGGGHLASALGWHAEVCARQGDLAAAWAALEEAEHIATTSGSARVAATLIQHRRALERIEDERL